MNNKNFEISPEFAIIGGVVVVAVVLALMALARSSGREEGFEDGVNHQRGWNDVFGFPNA